LQSRGSGIRGVDGNDVGQHAAAERDVGVVEAEVTAEQPEQGASIVRADLVSVEVGRRVRPRKVHRRDISTGLQAPDRRGGKKDEIAIAELALVPAGIAKSAAAAFDQAKRCTRMARKARRPGAARLQLLPKQPAGPEQGDGLTQGVHSGRSRIKSGRSMIDRPDWER
jgi:hypothetical protein